MNGGTATRFRPNFLHWYENDATETYPTSPMTITLPSNLARSELGIADVDADGDLDIITASRRLTTVEWFENLLPAAVDPIEAWARTFDPDIDVTLTSDADGDGANLLLEFAFNLHPLIHDAVLLPDTNGASGLPNASFELGESAVVSGTFIRRRDHEALDLVYEIQVGTDLVAWNDLEPGDATVIDDDYESVSFVGAVPAGIDRYFQRVRVTYMP